MKQDPPKVANDADQWALRAERLVEALESVTRGLSLNPDITVSQLKQRLRGYAGRSSGFVAFAECTSVERVKAARAALDVDPETGLQKVKPVTTRDFLS